ncbi:hypothetical protein EST38_g9784 [Candolleomyces aberdarensis]|uniref:Uncharacterized protein n=1 Tax=Candolleomyces aberdarensis TaxID=2316362 RepID=A0A4Q2DAS1_9AGAR|nr:hypothetical protein EST38_g9784 [Candolleomyces aberdarensis]
MLISTKIVLAISFLASSFAEPLAKRAYIPELKSTLARIDESWKKIETQIGALPKDATENDFKAAKAAMDSLTSYMAREYETVIRQNGPFTNSKWSDEFITDMKPYQANGANAMRTLKSYVPRINATGGVPLLKEFSYSTGSLNGAFGEMESFLGRHILQFVGGAPLLSPIREYRMVAEIRDAADLFYYTYCAIEWGHPCS